MVYSDVFAFDIQLLCAKGHYVLCANPMGSDGRGDAFADIRGQFCEVPYEQLMAFVDEVLDTFTEIDENALGVTGGSYGGYMTNHIITRTDRFRAAVSERGISNMLSALTASDIGFAYVAEYAGQTDLWSRPQVLLDMSPVLSAGAVKTPTLFNHGKEDFRCHYTESLNMYSALVQQGVPARLCLYEGENHSLVTRGRPKAKLTRYQELTRWFDRYLKRG
jgi:dipeptidyl aminopeptidase/acylaminoacyl peptidase